MAKKKIKKRKHRRPFDITMLFPNKIIPESIRGKKSLEKAIPCRFCQMAYLDNMIEELDRLITQKDMRIAIVDAPGCDLSKLYDMVREMGK